MPCFAPSPPSIATLTPRPCLPTHPATSQIEEDTDRDRYMSPLEAQAYGLIDHIVGGEEAVFQVRGSARCYWNACGGVLLALDVLPGNTMFAPAGHNRASPVAA